MNGLDYHVQRTKKAKRKILIRESWLLDGIMTVPRYVAYGRPIRTWFWSFSSRQRTLHLLIAPFIVIPLLAYL
eukprot:CAMPEP_0198285608 /NCGR_PEP_ID=MMETSP1449-20131203/4862_1 /TAXON_ID=420275 /ORGANISM="Attheya septentrionalis, Strain CCMP2084" /LENGTH=72 /DNA_ID=CAMNT_0043983083 /DNA_START=47 /DNA_END=261 /DNA_ORIENTATION=-